jgi:hypothetical protein
MIGPLPMIKTERILLSLGISFLGVGCTKLGKNKTLIEMIHCLSGLIIAHACFN